MMHGPEFQGTTTPYGYKQPDEYGRMRPTLPNPYEGATIGGGWDDDYRTMEELKRKNSGWWDQQIVPPSGIETLDEHANLEDDDILRIRGQYGVDADEAKRLYDDMIYGYDREVDQAGLWQDWKRIFERTGNSDLADSWIQSQQADASGIMEKYNQFTDKFGDIDVSGEGIEYEKDFDVPWGGTGTIEGQYGDDGLGGGIKFSWPLPLGRTAGMDTGLGSFDVAYRPGTYGPDYDDDDYGPFNPPSVYEMDDDWLYDPDKDEYEFDYIHGNLVNTGLA